MRKLLCVAGEKVLDLIYSRRRRLSPYDWKGDVFIHHRCGAEIWHLKYVFEFFLEFQGHTCVTDSCWKIMGLVWQRRTYIISRVKYTLLRAVTVTVADIERRFLLCMRFSHPMRWASDWQCSHCTRPICSHQNMSIFGLVRVARDIFANHVSIHYGFGNCNMQRLQLRLTYEYLA